VGVAPEHGLPERSYSECGVETFFYPASAIIAAAITFPGPISIAFRVLTYFVSSAAWKRIQH
jgi:hypothetical protein